MSSLEQLFSVMGAQFASRVAEKEVPWWMEIEGFALLLVPSVSMLPSSLGEWHNHTKAFAL